MIEGQLLNAIVNNGVAIAMLAWFALRLEKILGQIIDSNKLSDSAVRANTSMIRDLHSAIIELTKSHNRKKR